ncbi:hypothetical protein [Anoxybacteroides amylolyticum]|uniref:Copper amine oxidase-like N-terminal domain-containing protein n=1 Tax=Anoxybacteroides amylolyticum TaxID=294699 RepID=A0A160F4R3_9BACL|nr:hypothetical protein [Anoxybacillus amylolyticus]ANB60775.1 hypothetical protein GFC30_1400 [Anoxybacillus amylolyticus]
MMRTAILMIVLFLGISVGTLYMQWQDYGQTRNEVNNVPLVHFIDIKYNGKMLEIHQTVKGLTTPVYTIQVPIDAKQLTYTIGNDKRTLVYDRNGKASVKRHGHDKLEFHYILPLPSIKPIWLERWMVLFFSSQPQHLYVQLTDDTKSGMWVAGAPLEAVLKKKMSTFYSWSQKGVSSFPLYFHPIELPRNVYGTIEVYGGRKENVTKWTDVPSFTLVWVKGGMQHLSPTLVVVPETVSLPSLREMYMRTYYEAYFLPSGEMNTVVADLLTAFTLQKQPVTPKGKAIWQQLTEKLTKDEQKAFFTAVLKQRGKTLTPAMLDEALSASHAGKTMYFTDSFATGRPLSLVFTNEGKIYVNNVLLKQSKAILQNEEVLLPFVDVMSALGYHVRRTGEAVFIEKGDNRWRFFVNSSIYMKGNDRFGAPAIIIYEINGRLYMTPDMMQYWFPVQISMAERDVIVSSS